MDGCLYAYRQEDWDKLVDSRLAGLDPLSKEGRRMSRFFFSGAAEAELDKQGRVMIPAALIEHAGLGRNVIVAGVRDHLELWDAAAWRKEMKEVEGSAEDVAERLATKRD
jgi:MraZ protein